MSLYDRVMLNEARHSSQQVFDSMIEALKRLTDWSHKTLKRQDEVSDQRFDINWLERETKIPRAALKRNLNAFAKGGLLKIVRTHKIASHAARSAYGGRPETVHTYQLTDQGAQKAGVA